MLHRYFSLGIAFVMLFAAMPLTFAEDWPQFLGPERNGVSTETGLRLSWGADGPPKLWDKDVGEGFSGPVIAGDRLILFHRTDNKEIVECLRSDTGKPVWKFAYDTDYEDQLNKGNGPRSTPVLTSKHVVTLGAGGWLHCLDAETGKKLWGRNVNTDYQVAPSYFGVGTSPLVEGNRVLVNVGGKDAGIVAFDLLTGKEQWKATADGASYSSPVAAAAGKSRLAVFFTRQGVVLLDAVTGAVRYQTRWRARYDASVNAATPLIIGDKLFFSTSYETGALLLRLTRDGADKVWQSDEVMSNHYNTCVYKDGHLYGFDGRQERGPDLRCVDLESQKIKWNRPRFGCGSTLLADGHVIILTEKGDLVSVLATPDEYREKGRARALADGPCRAQIALANGRLFGRDQKKLVCWNLKK